MICLTCREAADDQRPADQHCGSTGGPGAACTCQHRVDRYQHRDGQAHDAAPGSRACRAQYPDQRPR